jgi:hypothetical protein
VGGPVWRGSRVRGGTDASNPLRAPSEIGALGGGDFRFSEQIKRLKIKRSFCQTSRTNVDEFTPELHINLKSTGKDSIEMDSTLVKFQ